MQWLVTGNLASLIPGSRWGYRLLQSVYSELVTDSYQMKRRISWLTNHTLMFKPIFISKKICENYNTIVCITYSLDPFDWFNVRKIFLLLLFFYKDGHCFCQQTTFLRTKKTNNLKSFERSWSFVNDFWI